MSVRELLVWLKKHLERCINFKSNSVICCRSADW